ncbi:MAG: glycoside hydrolase family 15 protein, partial [Steroidobacteraceae bacterium]
AAMDRKPYPPIADYALIGDCHSAALVSRSGSIDWCCLPRFDSASCFGRLLDWKTGGYFEVAPRTRYKVRREYLADSLVLATTFTSGAGEVRLTDFFAMREGGRTHPRRELVRIIEGVRGSLELSVRIVPRFDFGEVRPWIRRSGHSAFIAVGGNTGLLMFGDIALEPADEHSLQAQVRVAAGERLHLALQFVPPEDLHTASARAEDRDRLAAHYEETLRWWRGWSSKLVYPESAGAGIARSAVVLKALTYAPTGAIVAAPTTSLPEQVGGPRNWDYRYSWIRDSVYTAHALSELGLEAEADGFRQFIQRSAGGNAEDLQVLYAVDGRRRMVEIELAQLDGWRGSRPVRIGNGAARQYQADMFGLVLELSWRWSERGRPQQAEECWTFLAGIVEAAIAKWRLPDRGIWEVRSRPRHFVHSKVMCWAAVNRGIALAERYSLPAPLARWRKVRAEIRRAVESRGIDRTRGHFVESFGSADLDAALLLLPTVEFVPYDDERMLLTADAIQRELRKDGLILRYRTEDGLPKGEGVFLACTFWLAECLAHQSRVDRARELFERASACSNDLGLFAEEFDVRAKQLLGNFPQGLTHLAHISAALALNGSRASAQRKR